MNDSSYFSPGERAVFDNSSKSDPASQRREVRQPVDLDGICEVMDPIMRIPCKIIDLSGGGAQLEFDSTDRIPQNFKVYIDALSVIMECHAVWRTQTRIGVEQQTRSNAL